MNARALLWAAIAAAAWWFVRRNEPGSGSWFENVAEAQRAAMRAARGEKPW